MSEIAEGTIQLDAADVARFQMHGQDVAWLIDHWATNRGDHPFLIWEPKSGETQTWTYAEFATQTKAVAAGLAAKGVGVGDAMRHVLLAT